MANEIEIKISGSGTATQIANALKQIAADLEVGNHVNALAEKGECEWEDAILMTEISEN